VYFYNLQITDHDREKRQHTVNSLSKTPGICFHSNADYFLLKAYFKKIVVGLYSLLYSSKLYRKRMVLDVAKFEKTASELKRIPGVFEREFTVRKNN